MTIETKEQAQAQYERGAKFKKAGVIGFIVAAVIALLSGGSFMYGRHLQLEAQAAAKAQGWGTLTITPPPAAAPLGGKASGSGTSK